MSARLLARITMAAALILALGGCKDKLDPKKPTVDRGAVATTYALPLPSS